MSGETRATELPSKAIRESRSMVILVNIVKLLLFGALVPPVVSGLAQRAHVITDVNEAAAVATTVSTGAVFAAIGAMGFGRLADVGSTSRRSRWWWVLAGAIVGTPGLIAIATAESLVALVGGWAVAQLGFSGSMAVLRALLGSALPAHRRRGATAAVLLGYLGAALPLAMLFLLPDSVWLTSLSLALLGALVTATALRSTRNTAKPDTGDLPIRTAEGNRASETSKREGRFRRIRLLLLQVSVHTVTTTYLSYHALDLAIRIPTNAPEGVRTSVIVLGAALLGLTLSSALLLWRQVMLRRPYTVIAAAGAVMIASLLLRAASFSLPVLAGSAILSGAALGLVASALLAAALEASPKGRDGRFIGIFSAAGPVGQFVGPLLGLGLLQLFGHEGGSYSGVYIGLAVVPFAASLLCMRQAFLEFNSRSALH